MTVGELAGLIAAIAFVVFVVFIVILITRSIKTVEKVNDTIDETTVTIVQLKNDVHVLTKQVEGLLVKSNTLMDDINGKVQTVDPVFKALADLGVSISDLNDSSKTVLSKVAGITKNTGKAAVVTSIGKTALKMIKPKLKNRKKENSDGGK